jgi:hypothetical protein
MGRLTTVKELLELIELKILRAVNQRGHRANTFVLNSRYNVVILTSLGYGIKVVTLPSSW